MEEYCIINTFETPKRSRRNEEESFLDNSTISHSEGEFSNSQLKRGRPRAEVINHLIIEGTSSHSSIRCDICNRVFPREKSLQAHKRIHTGEKPYICDYPLCGKAFTQSGQLKTHQRLHTGEKPFICTVAGCNSRFTHANRHCSDHPFASLRRCHELALQPVISQAENSPEVLNWLENFKRRNEEKTPGKVEDTETNSHKKSSHNKRVWASQQQENNINYDQEQMKFRRSKGGIAKALHYGSPTSNSLDESTSVPLYRKLCEAVDPSTFGCTPLEWSPRPTKLFAESPSERVNISSGYESMLQDCKLNSTLDSSNDRSVNCSSLTETPLRPEKLKRRWLREALTNEPTSPKKCPNMMRPTVLMMATKPICPASPRFEPINTSTPAKPSLTSALQNAEKQWSGAIALMQLATSTNS